MCGACGFDPIPLLKDRNCCTLGLHYGDVVDIADTAECEPRIGIMEELDDDWGLAIVWTNGSRTWYPMAIWCPEADDIGFRIKLAETRLYVKTDDYKLANPEVGRGWLKKPPVTAQPVRPKGARRQRQVAEAPNTEEAIECEEANLCVPVEDE